MCVTRIVIEVGALASTDTLSVEAGRASDVTAFKRDDVLRDQVNRLHTQMFRQAPVPLLNRAPCANSFVSSDLATSTPVLVDKVSFFFLASHLPRAHA